MPLVDLDHHSLREQYPATRVTYPQVPAEGDTLTFAGTSFVVHHVHWWTPGLPDDAPAARLSLRTPLERRRAQDLEQM